MAKRTKREPSPIGVRFTRDQHELVKEVAKMNGQNISDLIRTLVVDCVKTKFPERCAEVFPAVPDTRYMLKRRP